MNHYFKQAQTFFKIYNSLFTNKLTYEIKIQGILFFAIGIEHLLKSILYDVNPLYLLEKPEFYNSLFMYEKIMVDRIVDNADVSTDTLKDGKLKKIKKQNDRIITGLESLKRAEYFSKATNNNFSPIYAAIKQRNIIAHRNLEELNMENITNLIENDSMIILEDYCDDLHIKIDTLIGDTPNSKIDQEKHDSNYLIFKVKIEKLKKEWKKRKENRIVKERINYLNNQYCKNKDNKYSLYVNTECPVCLNTAELLLSDEVEFDGFDHYDAGFVEGLMCYYCHFATQNYIEIDYLKLNEKYANNLQGIRDAQGRILTDALGRRIIPAGPRTLFDK